MTTNNPSPLEEFVSEIDEHLDDMETARGSLSEFYFSMTIREFAEALQKELAEIRELLERKEK